MNQIKKPFISSGIIAVLLIVSGALLIIYSKETSLMNMVPLLGGTYFAILTAIKYGQARQTVVVEYYVWLKAINKGGNGFLVETYQFEGVDENNIPIKICIAGNPKLTDDTGRALKEGYQYQLLYLTQEGRVEDYDNLFALNLVKGITVGGVANA